MPSIVLADLSQLECTNVNILNNPSVTAEVRAHFETAFDQQGSNLCFAHVAADILTFHTGRSISPIPLAHMTNGNEFSPMLAGYVSSAVQVVNRHPQICTNQGYNSRVADYTNPDCSITCTGRGAVRAKPVAVKFYRDCPQGQLPRNDLPVSFKEIMLSDVHAEIASMHPVGINVYSTLLEPEKEDMPAVPGMPHAMTIIGRHWSSERSQCEFVVRNSFGSKGCLGYDHSRLECSNFPTGYPNSGIFLMSENIFKQVIKSVTMLNHDESADVETTITPPNLCRPDPNPTPPPQGSPTNDPPPAPLCPALPQLADSEE